MIECICIDSNNKPDEIPLSKWINKDFKYHITHVYFHHGQGIQGVTLHEVRLTKECYPYVAYRLNRFAMTQKSLQELIQMIKDCTELNDFDILELIKESDLQIQN